MGKIGILGGWAAYPKPCSYFMIQLEPVLFYVLYDYGNEMESINAAACW